jgi:hypothetical protein
MRSLSFTQLSSERLAGMAVTLSRRSTTSCTPCGSGPGDRTAHTLPIVNWPGLGAIWLTSIAPPNRGAPKTLAPPIRRGLSLGADVINDPGALRLAVCGISAFLQHHPSKDDRLAVRHTIV